MDRPPPPPQVDHRGAPRVRRWEAQRWLIDDVIRANGIDWDQPRSLCSICRPAMTARRVRALASPPLVAQITILVAIFHGLL